MTHTTVLTKRGRVVARIGVVAVLVAGLAAGLFVPWDSAPWNTPLPERECTAARPYDCTPVEIQQAEQAEQDRADRAARAERASRAERTERAAVLPSSTPSKKASKKPAVKKPAVKKPAVKKQASPATGGPSAEQWEALRQCEASGDYTNLSSTGKYRGAYQFDRGTWASVGGSGDPAAASKSEQDARAQILYDSRGAQPWPICGKHLR